jgi:hypothetical protein
VHHRCSARLVAIAAAALCAASLGAQAPQGPALVAGCSDEPARFHPCALAKARGYDPARTPDGQPDLQGLWRGRTGGTENIEAHPEAFDTDEGPTLVVDPPDGRIPYQPWADAQRKVNVDTYVEPAVPCFPASVPRSMYMPSGFQIVQRPDQIVVMLERAHYYRVIRLDGSPHVGSNILLWQGDSRGHWEGNTLVVDVTNQNARNWFDQLGNFFSDAAHMVERFTPIDANAMHYEVRIEDPNVYTRPWTMAFAMRRNLARGYEQWEEACHEGDQNARHRLNLGQQIYPGVHGRQFR